MTIQAICSDIDGTLLNKERELSERTIRVLQHIGNQMPVVLASSRMPSAMRHLQHQLGIDEHPLICYNGGYVLVYENHVPRVIHSVDLPLEVARYVTAVVENRSIHASFYSEDNWYASQMDQWSAREEKVTKVKPVIKMAHDVVAQFESTKAPVHKVMCMGPEDEIARLEEMINNNFSVHVHAFRSKTTYLEITPRPVSKATALEKVLALKNIALSNALAFGDNYNDIDLLKHAGIGVAVENARPEVKAVANELTLANIDDGVAVALEKYLNIRY